MSKTVEIRRIIQTKCDTQITSIWVDTKESDIDAVMDSIEYCISEISEYRIRTWSNTVRIINAKNVRYCDVEFREVDNG